MKSSAEKQAKPIRSDLLRSAALTVNG